VPPELVTLAHDPQTSGGLLAAVPADLVATVEGAFDAAGVERWWIGRVEAGGPGVTLA
jgi:selenide,water dikinase